MGGLRRLGTGLCLLVLASIVAGCVVEQRPGYRGNWCYWHPNACR